MDGWEDRGRVWTGHLSILCPRAVTNGRCLDIIGHIFGQPERIGALLDVLFCPSLRPVGPPGHEHASIVFLFLFLCLLCPFVSILPGDDYFACNVCSPVHMRARREVFKLCSWH